MKTGYSLLVSSSQFSNSCPDLCQKLFKWPEWLLKKALRRILHSPPPPIISFFFLKMTKTERIVPRRVVKAAFSLPLSSMWEVWEIESIREEWRNLLRCTERSHREAGRHQIFNEKEQNRTQSDYREICNSVVSPQVEKSNLQLSKWKKPLVMSMKRVSLLSEEVTVAKLWFLWRWFPFLEVSRTVGNTFSVLDTSLATLRKIERHGSFNFRSKMVTW